MSVHAYVGGCRPCLWLSSVPTRSTSDRQLIGSCASVQVAAQADTRNRCDGSVQESLGANILSWSPYVAAHVQ